MNQITRTFSFRSTSAGLSPTSPRSLKDLQQNALHQKAAQVAESVQQQGREIDASINSKEGSAADSNQDFPGHVTVAGLEYDGKKLDGGTVRASRHPRELDGTKATLTKERMFWFDSKTEYRVKGDSVARVLNPESRKSVSQTVRENDGLTTLTVTGKPGSHELLGLEQGSDFELPQRSSTSSSRDFSLLDARTFNEDEPWYYTDTSRITDPKKAADRSAARQANTAIKEVMGVYDQALALDGSDLDLNERPGEVLLENAPLGDRLVSGSVRPLYTRNGATAENPNAGSYFKEDRSPYMEMKSENTGEIFKASFDRVRDYDDNHAQEIFIHSTPEKTVKARVGESRSWYEGQEPGWYPHYEDDTDYPMGRDNLGGSVFISK